MTGNCDINSNIVPPKVLPECYIDLTKSDNASYETLIIDDETETLSGPQVCYSDISSKELTECDFETTQHLHDNWTEEGELQDENDYTKKTVEQKTEIYKQTIKRCIRKSSFSISNECAQTRRYKIKTDVQCIKNNQQLPDPRSFIKNKFIENAILNKKTKLLNNPTSSYKVTIENIQIKRCKFLMQNPVGVHNDSKLKTTKYRSYQRESFEVCPNNARAEQSLRRRLQSRDRPIPECRRNCRHNKKDYIPKYVEYCNQILPRSSCIISNQLRISDSKLDPSLSDSDIESLITRSRMREGISNKTWNTIFADTLNSTEDSEIKDDHRKSSEYSDMGLNDYVQFEKEFLPIVDLTRDSDVDSDTNKTKPDSQSIQSYGVRVVPIKTLLKSITASGIDSLENVVANCKPTVVSDASTVQPITPVKLSNNCDNKKIKNIKRKRKKSAKGIELALVNV